MKKMIAMFMAAALLAAPVASAHQTLELAIGQKTYLQREQKQVIKKELDVPAYVENGRTMVPVRLVAEEFGAAVDWDEATSTVSISKDGQMITLTIGVSEAWHNGEQKNLDVPPVLLGERTMVPLRFCAEMLGNTVEYIEEAQRVFITDKPAVMTIGDFSVSYDEFDMMFENNRHVLLTEEQGAPQEEVDAAKQELKKAILLSVQKTYGLYAVALESGLVKEWEGSDFAEEFKYQAEIFDSYGFLGGVAANFTWKENVAQNYINHVFQSNMNALSKEQMQQYYKEHYVTAKHILIPIIDLATNQPLPKEEQQAALKLAEDILKKIKQKQDFDALMHKHSKDTGLQTAPDGYTFAPGRMVEQFDVAARSLSEGEVSGIVETEYGYHIIKRLPLAQMDDLTELEVKQQLADDQMASQLDDIMKKYPVVVNETAWALIR